MLKIGGTVTKEYNLTNLVKPKYTEMHRNGAIHIHDLDFMALCFNCLQIPLGKLLDNGFLTIKEDESYSSPISSVFYEYYDSVNELNSKLKEDDLKIQCVVSDGIIENGIPFGETQKPKLWDYADNVDTLEFLIYL